jgi:GT2 family glycosyltransferase
MRPKPLTDLLESVNKQLLYPDEILIIDGSKDERTKEALEQSTYKNLTYFKVEDKDRGLTKQRNFGIAKVAEDIDIVCFLDDDIILEDTYFENLINTYQEYPNAGGVGGYIINNQRWKKLEATDKIATNDFVFDGWSKKLSRRSALRKRFGLDSDRPPCHMPTFGHGYPVSSLPPNDKTYPAEYFLGGVSSFKKHVVDTIKFSEYFIGYGLYEDLEYCLRVSKEHSIYVNTSAKLYHYHEESGRPDKFKYGKMVVRNGWYVWKTRHPKVKTKDTFKWLKIILLLALIKLTNSFSGNKKALHFQEFCGRIFGLTTLIFNAPKPNRST